MMDISHENILAQRCQEGQLEYFAELYDTYIERIYAFLLSRTRNKALAQDITSHTFMKAIEKIKTFDASRGTFSAWLYRIARNTLIDYFRTHKDTVDIDDVWGISDDTDTIKNAHARLQIETIRAYLQKLDPDQRDVVLMRVWDELSYKEIAHIMNKSEGSCKMMFSRTVEKMQKDLGVSMALLISLISQSHYF